MLKIKLQALDHPTPDNVDFHDRKVFASTILWLEDQKIRSYKIEDRAGLRNVDELAVWEEAYAQYRTDLGMPPFQNALEELSWILGYAVRLEFLDAPDNYTAINSTVIGQQNTKSIAPTIQAENLYDNMDFNHKEFIAGVRKLASKLNVPHHPNHLIQLEAVARIVKERLSPQAESRQPIEGTPFPFETATDVVVAAEDAALDYSVRILRLLQIHSLRELQTCINETIVAVQDLTANPKTDTKLGKVGR